ncbi:MAG: hypothetical protein MJE66_17305 [Proteobacteria bacterium]|nr:hypothetical protein [Pseudomonadota bacterium]
MGALLSLAGLGVVLAAGVSWFRRMGQVRVPHDRTAYLTAMGVGAALGAFGLWLGSGWLGGLAGTVALLGGGIFVGLRLQSTQQAREPSVRVGGPILHFTLPDAEGKPFDLASLSGRPFLLKFFRGHW